MMDPSRFQGPRLQAAPGLLQMIANWFSGAPRVQSDGFRPSGGPPTREGIGVLPAMAPEQPMQPAGPSYFEDLNAPAAAPVHQAVSAPVPIPIPRQKPVTVPIPRQKPVVRSQGTKKTPQVQKAAPKPTPKPAAKKWTSKDAYNRRQAERGGSMRMK